MPVDESKILLDKWQNSVDPDQICSEAFDLGLDCLAGPIYLNTSGNKYGNQKILFFLFL